MRTIHGRIDILEKPVLYARLLSFRNIAWLQNFCTYLKVKLLESAPFRETKTISTKFWNEKFEKVKQVVELSLLLGC